MRWRAVPVALALLGCLGGLPDAAGGAEESPPLMVAPQLGHGDRIALAAFLPDGKSVVSAGHDKRIKLWDPRTGREVRSVAEAPDDIVEAAVSPDGRLILSIDNSQGVRLWELPSGRELGHVEPPPNATRVYGPVFSPDGRTLAIVFSMSGDESSRQDMKLFGLPDLQPLRILERPGDEIVALAFRPDGSGLLASQRGEVVEWDVASGRMLRSGAVPSLDFGMTASFSPDRRALAVLSGASLKLLDLGGGRELKAATVADTWRRAGPFSPDGSLLTIVADDGVVLWDVAAWSVAGRIPLAEQDEPVTVAFSPDSRLILTGGPTGRIGLWDAATGEPRGTLSGGGRVVRAVAWSPDGKLVAAGGDMREVGLWDPATGALSHALTPEGASVAALAFSPDGGRLLAGGGDRVTLIDLRARRTIRSVTPGRDVRAVAFTADGKSFLSGTGMDFDGGTAVKMWDAGSGRLLRSFPNPIPLASSLATSRDGKTLYVGGAGLEAWDIAGARLRHRRDWMGGMVASLAIWPDGKSGVLGSWSGDDELQTWSTADGEAIRRFESAGVNAVAIVPGTTTFAAGDIGGAVKVWDARSGAMLKALVGHASQVSALAASPDGRRLVSGSLDGSMRVWSIGGEHLATSVVAEGREWVTVTPEGFFAASPNGARLLNIVRGRDLVGPVGRAYDLLHRPDLVAEKLAGDPHGKVREAAARLDLAKVMAAGAE